MNNIIYDEVLRTVQQYGTRDPFEILEGMGVTVFFQTSSLRMV